MNPANPKTPIAKTPSSPALPSKPTRQLKFDSKTLRWILIGSLILSVLILLIVSSYGLSLLGGKSRELVDLKVQSLTAEQQLTNLEKSKKEVEHYTYFKEVAKTVIPAEKDQAATVLEVFKIADQSGLSIQSITFPSSNLGLGTTLGTRDATSSAAKQNVITQARPVSGISGLYSLELTITPETGPEAPPDKHVTYAKMLNFLKRIENNRHTAQITQVNIQPENSGHGLSFALTINIFIKP